MSTSQTNNGANTGAVSPSICLSCKLTIDAGTMRCKCGPAYSVEGQECAQCGGPAFWCCLVPFCRSHSQDTIAAAIKAAGIPADDCWSGSLDEHIAERAGR